MTARCEYCGSRHRRQEATSGCPNCGAPIEWRSPVEEMMTRREGGEMRGYSLSEMHPYAQSAYASYLQQNPTLMYSDYLRRQW